MSSSCSSRISIIRLWKGSAKARTVRADRLAHRADAALGGSDQPLARFQEGDADQAWHSGLSHLSSGLVNAARLDPWQAHVIVVDACASRIDLLRISTSALLRLIGLLVEMGSVGFLVGTLFGLNPLLPAAGRA
jgi:hypothetical protein